MTDAEIGVTGVLAGVVLGWCLTEATRWLERRRRAHGLYESLRAEIEECAEQANVYIESRIPGPAYRLPMDAYRRAIDVLTADGKVSANEFRALRRFYATVDEFNRVLDHIDEHGASASNEWVGDQLHRNVRKARRLTRDGEHYKLANAALVRRCV